MSKKHTIAKAIFDPLDIRSYLHQPHDKYVRAVLQNRTTVLQLLEYLLTPDIFKRIEKESLQLTNATFINRSLKSNLADICYEGLLKNQWNVRVCILFEHKSDDTDWKYIYEQLMRYITEVWAEDRKQNRGLTLTIPIVIYHGKHPVEKILPRTLFEGVPPELVEFVPHINYILLDTARMSEADIAGLPYWMLSHFLWALKFGRDEEYLERSWKKALIFAKGNMDEFDHDLSFLIETTLNYMVSISKTVQKKVDNLESTLTQEELSAVPPFVFGKYFLKGRAEGIEEGEKRGEKRGEMNATLRLIRIFVKNNPQVSDEEIAATFEVDSKIVKLARKPD